MTLESPIQVKITAISESRVNTVVETLEKEFRVFPTSRLIKTPEGTFLIYLSLAEIDPTHRRS